MDRLTVKPFTFSDGTHIPTGTYIHAATASIQTDENYYPNPTQFDPFRFSNLQEADSHKNEFASTASDYLPFGHGKHAWYAGPATTTVYPTDSHCLH